MWHESRSSSTISSCQRLQQYLDSPSTWIRHPLPFKQTRLDVRASSDAGFDVSRRLGRLSSLSHRSSQIGRIRRKCIGKRGERIDERARRRARPRIRVQLSQGRGDAAGPVLLGGDANTVGRQGLSKSGKENSDRPRSVRTVVKWCGKGNPRVKCTAGAAHLLGSHFRYGDEGTNDVLAGDRACAETGEYSWMYEQDT